LAQTGQKFLTYVKIGLYDAVNLAGNMYSKVVSLFGAFTGLANKMMSVKIVAFGIKTAWDIVTTSLSVTWNALKITVGGVFDFIVNGLNALSNLVDYVMGSSLVQGMKTGFDNIKEAVLGMLDYVSTPLTRLKDALEGIFTMLKGIKNFDYDQVKSGLSEVKSGINGTTQRERAQKPASGKEIGQAVADAQKDKDNSIVNKDFKLSTNSDQAKKVNKELNASTQRVTTGGVRNITVNVGVMKGADKIVVEGAKGLTYNQVEDSLMEMLVRVIQGTERSISRG
jgi:hypothetical protein